MTIAANQRDTRTPPGNGAGKRPTAEPAPGRTNGRRAAGAGFRDMPLVGKVALIPALTLLLMGLMLAGFVRMSELNTAALRSLDRNVFEPLNRAQTMKDEITLLHARLFALLSLGNNATDPVAQQASADAMTARLDLEAAKFGQFLDSSNSMLPPVAAARLRVEFDAYVARVRETTAFAAFDASYGAFFAGVTDDHFGRLHADLDDVVETLAQRRISLTEEAIGNSRDARHLQMILGVGAAALALLGSALVGRGIARPMLRLTASMNRLAGGDTDLTVPGAERRDEVGAMARAVEGFRLDAIARRQAEVELRRTNLQFDAALNSMHHGMVVWGPDHRVQLVNARYAAVCGMPAGCVRPGMTVAEVMATCVRHGLYPDRDPDELVAEAVQRLIGRWPLQFELAMGPGLIVLIAYQPMSNGGTIITVEDVTEKRHNEARIAFMAKHDALTSLPNRRLFQEHLEAAVGAVGEGQHFAVLCLDLDHFKEVNDTLGHAAGDEVLRLAAGRLRHCARDEDVIARLGGDEFAILLRGPVEGPAPAAGLAARLVESIGALFEIQGHNVVIGTSIGIALGEPQVSAGELLKRADVALYRAKEERGGYAFFEEGMAANLMARRELEADLRLAVQRDEFELYYQPFYSLPEDRVTGFEALLRWNSPTRGRVAPGEFIRVAERTGLISAIGEWVLRTACAEAAGWPDHVAVAVNLSPVQFKNKRLPLLVREILDQTGLPARRLEIEITETVLLQDTEAGMATLHSLHELGVRVSMDDFGTGYSSLSYLLRFPFDKIKIDRSFIKEFRDAPSRAAGDAHGPGTASRAARNAAIILRTIIGLGENLGITTIAEGVETAEQLAHIRDLGCSQVQGYFISPARPATELEALWQRLDISMPAMSGPATSGPAMSGTAMPGASGSTARKVA